jgi:multidrug efflux pump subunit AcrB
MSIAKLAVTRWQFTLVVFAALVALGLESLFAIPKAEDPTFPLPIFSVVAVLPGSAPADVERLVVDPIEAKLKTLGDLKSVKSEIEDGLGVVLVEFQTGVDVPRKHDEVVREVNALRPTLPAELALLEVKEQNAAKVNVIELALVSDATPFVELERHARRVKRRLQAVAGVGDVEVAGLPKQEVSVSLDVERLVARGISPAEVIAAIGGDATNVPAGSIDAGARRFDVKTSGDYGSLDEIRSTVVRHGDGAAVTVGELADVRIDDAEATQLARFDGQRAVLVTANMREGQNIFEVKKAIDAALVELAPSLPPKVALLRGFDQSNNVAHRLGGFARDFGLAILLVLLTLLPLGVRASIVVMVSIPLSLAMGLLAMRVTGYSINQLSIVGMVIALGLLVDDSVVVVENIARFLRMGKSPREAAIAATDQITLSVLGCTATLIFAFLPLLALPGTSGAFIRSLPVAVIFTVASSLAVSLTIVPFLSSRILVAESEHGNVVFRAMTWLIEGTYARVLERAMRAPVLTLLAALGLLIGSFALVPRIGFSLFPKAGIPQFLVSIEAAEGASLAETDRAARFVEATLHRHPEIRSVATSVGKGHPQIYYNVAPKNQKANVADVFAEAHVERRTELAALLETLRAELALYPGAKLTVREFENGPPLEAPIAIRLLGDDREALARASSMVATVMRKTVGTRDVRDPAEASRTDLRVVIDRDKSAMLGVAVPDVDRAVRLAIGGVLAGSYRDERAEEAWDLRVAMARPIGNESTSLTRNRQDFSAFERTWLASTRGAPVPLGAVATLGLERSPTTIRHYDRERSVTVTADVAPGQNTDRLARAVLAEVNALSLPPGVRAVAAGELENRSQSLGGMGAAIVVAIFGVLAVLVLEFRTFKGTLIVASVIPLGIIGGLGALYVSGNTLSFTATIGFVALMGIEVKNSILLVDFTNQLRMSGMGVEEAVKKAGEIRFVPILLTTLTAIGGLIPLIVERSPLYSPLAWVLLGGLVSSTLLARVVTPVVYRLLPPEIEPLDERGAGDAPTGEAISGAPA